MAFVKPPARNMPPGSEPWAQWVEEQMSSVTKQTVAVSQYAERAAGGANSALEGNIQNWDEINRVFEVTEKSTQLADGAVVWSTLDPELPEDVPINPNVIWYTYVPETREVLRMWQWGYYDDVEGIYVEDWYQAQLGADSIHDEAITSAKVALGAIDWDQIAPDVENTVTTAQETADKAAADLLIEKDRVNAELAPVKSDLSTLKTTTIPNLQTALTNVEGAAQSADKRSTVSTAAPSDTTGFPQNAAWQRINDSGAVIGSWRLSGSSWVQMPLDPVVIPNLSAGIITSGVLDTNRINAQEVAGAVGSFLSLNTGQITWDNAAGNNAFIGSLVGEQAFLTSLYATQLAVGPDNLIPDPLFTTMRTERGVGTGWTTFYSAVAGGQALRYQGTTEGYFDLLGTRSGGTDPTAKWLPVTPGDQYALTYNVYNSGYPTWRWQANFTAADGTRSWVILGTNGSGMTNKTESFTVPAGVTKMSIRAYIFNPDGVAGSWAVYGDNLLSLRRKTGSVLIEDGAVNADKITASQELSAKVAEFLSVKTGQITWDNAAGNNLFVENLVTLQSFVERLQASQISVSASNLIMFTPTLPAVLYGGISGVTVTPRTDTGRGGFYTFGGGTGTDGTLADCAHLTTKCVAGNVTGRIACAPGDKFSLSARLGMSAWHGTPPLGADVRRGLIRVSFYDADNAYITRFHGSIADAGDYGKGNLSELQVTAPANARYMAVFLQSALWSSGSLTMTELRVSRSVGNVLIEDGAVTADKIVANAITARELAVGAITADKAIIANSAIKSAMIAEANILSAHIEDLAVTNGKIANATITDAKILNLDAGKITTGFLDAARIQANSIVTSKLAATAIDGMTITGSTIQTSSSANTGIKIDTANGLRAWAGGNLGVQISPSIKNGMAVRNPVGEMVPLSDAAFGTVSIARSNGLSVAAPQTSGAWSAWTRHSDSLDDCILTFTAVSTRYIVSWSQSWATSYDSASSKQTGVQVGLSTGGSSNLIPSGNGGQITGLVGYLQERSADVGDRVRSVTMQGPLSTVVGQTYTLRMYFRYNANGPGTHTISVAARTITATPVY